MFVRSKNHLLCKVDEKHSTAIIIVFQVSAKMERQNTLILNPIRRFANKRLVIHLVGRMDAGSRIG